MTPFGAREAFKTLGLDAPRAAFLFGRHERTVWRWLDDDGEGPPEHVALALTGLMDGWLNRHPNSVRAFVKRCMSRRDGDRYERENRP